jgi:hypothetical protein
VANAVVAGYAEVAAIPGPLRLDIFSASVCASLNWLASRIRIALRETDIEARELADRAVPVLLANPPSRTGLQAILDALT